MLVMDNEKKWPYFSRKFLEFIGSKGVTVYRICEDTPLKSSNLDPISKGTKRATDTTLEAIAEYFEDPNLFIKMKAWRAIDEEGAAAILEAAKELDPARFKEHEAAIMAEVYKKTGKEPPK